MRYLYILLFVTIICKLLVGCAHFTGPTGRDGYRVSCDALTDCYEKSNKLCPNGCAIFEYQDNWFGPDHTIIVECNEKK